MATKKRWRSRRKRTAPRQKRLPPTPPLPRPPTQQPLTESWAALDQTAQQVREMHEEHLQRGFAATLSGGSISEPLPIAAERGDEANFTAVVEPPFSVVPTVYPNEPGGVVVVQNHITIDINSAEFRDFNSKLDDVIGLLRRSNEISGEARDQFIAEIKAGRALLEAPKVNPKLIELLLKRPLTYLADKATGALMGAAAATALMLLGKLTGLW
jgi:hypothetical protein